MEVNKAKLSCPYCGYESKFEDFVYLDDLPDLEDIVGYGVDIDEAVCPSCKKEFIANVCAYIAIICEGYSKGE